MDGSSSEVLQNRTGPHNLGLYSEVALTLQLHSECCRLIPHVVCGAETEPMLGGHLGFWPRTVSLKLPLNLVAYWVEITVTECPFLKVPEERGRERDLRTGDWPETVRLHLEGTVMAPSLSSQTSDKQSNQMESMSVEIPRFDILLLLRLLQR